jgi:predicted dithiol-disulfide oxidoreductase (DUF899 family)
MAEQSAHAGRHHSPAGIRPVAGATPTSRAASATRSCSAGRRHRAKRDAGYYPILDRAPKGRDEGDAWQVWIRRHGEYDSQ